MLNDIYFTEGGSAGYIPTAVPNLIPVGLNSNKKLSFLQVQIRSARDILTFVALVPSL